MSVCEGARLLCCDLDGTLLGKPDSTADFTCTWRELGGRLLVYNTGRLLKDARRVVAAGGLPEPDYYITGVGTAIYDVVGGVLEGILVDPR